MQFSSGRPCWETFENSAQIGFGGYEAGSLENPSGPKDSWGRVVRGGSWADPPQYIRVSARNAVEPADRENFIGFAQLLTFMKMIRADLDFALLLTRLENVVGRLYPYELLHLGAESLFDPGRHVSAEVCLAVQQAGQRLTGNAQHFGGGSNRQVVRRNDLGEDNFAGMRRICTLAWLTPYFFLGIVRK